jgi:putative ABC transport system permease protein
MKFLKLLKILILRNIREEKFLTFLSILGIALGIGLFTGVKVASDRAIASFESDIRGINPYSNYEILHISGIDFHEDVYKNVLSLEEKSLPVLKTFGYIPAFKDTIDINGIYTVKAIPFLQLSQKSPFSPSFIKASKEGFLYKKYNLEEFYRQRNGILITKKFAERYSLKKGNIFHALVYDKEYSLKVIDILDAEALLTNTIIMDIGNFQEYFRKTGYLSKLDLVSDEKTAEKINKILPSDLRIEKKEVLFKNQKALVASFRYNLQFVSLIAILVGVFLLYNTVFISIVKRRTEIGILRGLGADRKIIVLLFTIQGIVLGLVGSVLGIVFGQLAAYFSVIAVEKTISTMYSAVSISDYMITGQDALMALILGLIVSLLASVIPSFEASKIRPNESSREGSFEGRYRKYHTWLSLAGILFILSGVIVSYLDYIYTPFAFPILAYTGILFIIAGFTFIAPFYLSLILRIIRWPAEYFFRAIGKITLGDMRGNIYRFSVALMSVAISSALIIALLMLIFSFRNSLKGWIHKNITADIYIKPSSCKANYCFYPMSEKVIDIVKDFPEVEGVDKFRGLQLELYGKKVTAGFADVEVKRNYLPRRYSDRQYEEILKEMEGSEPVAGISDYLSLKYGLKKGDTIELQSSNGNVFFKINDIFSSYATTSGFIYIDRKWLKKYWGLDDTTQMSIYVKKDVNVNQLMYKLRERLLPDYSLEIMNNQELRDKIMDIFNKTFAITYAIEFISIIVSLIGVINTLLALVFERKREISIIRYLGGSWKQIQQNLILSAGIIGLTGILLGMLLGPLMSIILIHVVNKISFGWEIHFQIPFAYLSVVTGMLFLTTLLAGFLPSKVARKIDPRRFVSFE